MNFFLISRPYVCKRLKTILGERREKEKGQYTRKTELKDTIPWQYARKYSTTLAYSIQALKKEPVTALARCRADPHFCVHGTAPLVEEEEKQSLSCSSRCHNEGRWGARPGGLSRRRDRKEWHERYILEWWRRRPLKGRMLAMAASRIIKLVPKPFFTEHCVAIPSQLPNSSKSAVTFISGIFHYLTSAGTCCVWDLGTPAIRPGPLPGHPHPSPWSFQCTQNRPQFILLSQYRYRLDLSPET